MSGRTHSIHPLAVCVIEIRLGHVVPAFQTFGIHPDLYRAMHMDLFLLFTHRLWNLTRATPIDPVLERTNHRPHVSGSESGGATGPKRVKTHTANKAPTTRRADSACGVARE